MNSTLSEALANSTNFGLVLTNQEYSTLKQLYEITSAFTQNELRANSSGRLRRAVHSLEDLGTAFEHYDKQSEKHIMFPGGAVVLLVRLASYISSINNQEFIQSVHVVDLMQKLRQAMQQQRLRDAQ
jgi:hypothetical protein